MLVLTRELEESIVIDGKTDVKILGIRNGHVRLGIDAPKEITVHREEVQLAIEREAA